MVRIKGFVSGIYIAVSLVPAVPLALFMFTLMMDSSASYVIPAAIWACICFFLKALACRLIAPVAFRRYAVDSTGIRCGKLHLRYDEIRSISIHSGYVREQFGFRSFEHFFGITQYLEIYTEDVICINCEFNGYDRRGTEKCIYLPRNARIDSALRKYCEGYNEISDAYSDKYGDERSCEKQLNVKAFILAAFQILIISSLVILLAGIGSIGWVKAACLIALWAAFDLSSIFKAWAAVMLRNHMRKQIRSDLDTSG